MTENSEVKASLYYCSTKVVRCQMTDRLLSSNISSTCPHNMVKFGPLAAEIISLVWGTPGNFNWFRVLAAFLHGTLVVGVSQTAALNRGRHLYSAGRPSRWALVHISILRIILGCFENRAPVYYGPHIPMYLSTCVISVNTPVQTRLSCEVRLML